MVQFTKLRLSGFKSFVDPTELLIEPGVTGVVGPNGCGKSNLLEALRWTMGEGSAKRMRGGEMDDIIFSGTAERPARNIAEVTLYLDNSSRDAPSLYNEHDDIEITRRIERGAGSHYRINGREARARDVQLLFADLSTGPRSTAIVSQGRVGSLINAKPIQRRLLLEEAAGITGLHSRRHEAELRLNAAETNLERLDDVVIALEEQLAGLKRQARQAARYRSISDRIRRAESVQLHLRWQAATTALEETREALAGAGAQVTEHTREAAAAATEQAGAAATLPELRQAEAEAAAQLHRLVVAREALDAEESRLQAARQESETRLAQVDADILREQGMLDDAGAALERLAAERSEIESAQARQAETEKDSGRAVAEAEDIATKRETELTEFTEKVMAEEAHRSNLARQAAEAESRRARLVERADAVAEERAALEGGDGGAIAKAESAVTDAQRAQDDAGAEAEAAEEAHRQSREAETERRTALRAAEETHAALRAEIDGLTKLLAAEDETGWRPVLDGIEVTAGYEAALGAALGDDLVASDDEGAPAHWRALPPIDDAAPLPAGAEPLDEFVDAPPALARRLSQVGVVADDDAGEELREELASGQRLVTADGALWRWDGYTVMAGAATPAAARLEQRNRLAEARPELARAEKRLATENKNHQTAQEAAEDASGRERTAREALRGAYAGLAGAREALAEASSAFTANSSRLAAIEDSAERLAADLAEADMLLAKARDAEDDASFAGEDRAKLESLREEVGAVRTTLAEARHAFNRLQVEAAGRGDRIETIANEAAAWGRRTEDGKAQIAQLGERRAGVAGAAERLAERPKEIEAQRGELLGHVETAEARRRDTADRLAEAETRLGGIEGRLKAAEAALADAREDRGRCEGAVSQAELALSTVVERVGERLGCAPAGALALAELKDGEALPEMDVIDIRVDRLLRERENMGPVNLRAEHEAEDLGEQITTMQDERADLLSAITRLRHGIAELNREGRERLLKSFEEVNQHFQELFVRLFGGGRAHLTLTESDDPLESGLEIMASPPGKRLQVMSLLSGGEQALTAISLLFAVFLTNPAPICILDEVDAPLDDANVDRFCSMIDEIAHASQTRFLLITHHRMTMARMDRLFGVTMPERGVSQLVSVDLQSAESLRVSA